MYVCMYVRIYIYIYIDIWNLSLRKPSMAAAQALFATSCRVACTFIMVAIFYPFKSINIQIYKSIHYCQIYTSIYRLHSCHILPFQPVLRNRRFPSEPVTSAQNSPKSISDMASICIIPRIITMIIITCRVARTIIIRNPRHTVDFGHFIVFFWAETLAHWNPTSCQTNTSRINLFGFETLKLKIRRLKLWKPTVHGLQTYLRQLADPRP